MRSVIDHIKTEIAVVERQLKQLHLALAVLESKNEDGEYPPAVNGEVMEVSCSVSGAKGNEEINRVVDQAVLAGLAAAQGHDLRPLKQALMPHALVEDHINGMVFKMKPEQKAFLALLGEHDYVSKAMVKQCYPCGFSRFYDDLEELRGFAKQAGAEINTHKGPNRGFRLETADSA